MRNGRRIPKVLSAIEQQAILRVPNKRYPTGLRNYAMMKLMLTAGLRCSEVLSLRIGDIDWTSGRLHVVEGKGSKDRVLWLLVDTLDDLRKWRERRPPGLGAANELLFTTFAGGKMKPQYLWKMVVRTGTKAHIERRVFPHLLRHTFATDLLRSCKNLEVVRKALGHALPNTTSIYTHLVDDDVREAMRGMGEDAEV